ncbi:3220_t:CDS:2 [Ambispora gerdemannii]|uniref:3220_t:CDS:1 n=1 Tax=Ambispora gerdemannii TaxID=144530 RepID=A0A9N9D7H1_9GLOM|nr:3220_t:CDS:2 [Ambispora gerdemannii]
MDASCHVNLPPSSFRMMSIFHDELIKQDELLEEINGSILRSENTVRKC